MAQRNGILVLSRNFRDIKSRVRNFLQDFWAPSTSKNVAASILFALLSPFSWGYSSVQKIRRSLYRRKIISQQSLDKPVISIGGLRVGGSGKTPFALWMAQKLTSRGYQVVLLTRGYGRRDRRDTIFLAHSTLPQWDPSDCGDEPYLLARSLPDVPVVVDSNRYRAARFGEKKYPVDIFLLDDGFQHLPLRRDCDIVLLPDSDNLIHTPCLPKGPLREPLSALKDAHFIVRVSSKNEYNTEIEKDHYEIKGQELSVKGPAFSVELSPKGIYTLKRQRPIDVHTLKGRKIFAFCGIAQPNSFWETLEKMGLEIECRKSYSDHHRYCEQDHQLILQLLASVDFAVTTEKDAVKLQRFNWPARKVLVLKIEMIMEKEEVFWNHFEALNILSPPKKV